MTDEQIITEILEREGGGTYTDLESDAGGPTRWGVTQAALAKWRGHEVAPGDVAALTEAEARAIYRQDYIVGPGFGKIANDQLRALVVDCGVLHGADDAVEMLQRALGGLTVDGVFGPKTLAALWHVDVRLLWVDLMCERIEFLGRRISKSKVDADGNKRTDAADQAAGHLNRCTRMLREFVRQG